MSQNLNNVTIQNEKSSKDTEDNEKRTKSTNISVKLPDAEDYEMAGRESE